jgi:hypothetical protein
MLAGDRSRYQPKETVMNPIRRIRRLAGILAAVAGALLALAAASPALAATASVPHYGPPASGAPAAPAVVTRTVVVGGMPGWQIALIAAGTALLAAAIAVLADRTRAAHRHAITTTA